MILHRYLTEWCKHPHCSVSCCLALLLPLNDLQGDIHGLAESNVVNEQLETGKMDAPTITGAVQDSGVIDTTLKTGQQGGVVKEEQRQNTQYLKKRCDKGIQTDHFEPSYANGRVDGLQERSLLTSKYNYGFRGVYWVASHPRLWGSKTREKKKLRTVVCIMV